MYFDEFFGMTAVVAGLGLSRRMVEGEGMLFIPKFRGIVFDDAILERASGERFIDTKFGDFRSIDNGVAGCVVLNASFLTMYTRFGFSFSGGIMS